MQNIQDNIKYKELSIESWIFCGRFVLWWSMVNHSWL